MHNVRCKGGGERVICKIVYVEGEDEVVEGGEVLGQYK